MLEFLRQSKGKENRWNVVPFFDGDDRLPTHADLQRKLFLRDVHRYTHLMDFVLYLRSHLIIIRCAMRMSSMLYIWESKGKDDTLRP